MSATKQVGLFQRSAPKESAYGYKWSSFHTVAFRASDLERSIRWYEDAFGARKVFHAQQQGERPELLFIEFAKGQFIELFTNGKTKVQQPPDAIGYQHFCLVVVIGTSAIALRRPTYIHIGDPSPARRISYSIYLRPGRQYHRTDANPAGVAHLSGVRPANADDQRALNAF